MNRAAAVFLGIGLVVPFAGGFAGASVARAEERPLIGPAQSMGAQPLALEADGVEFGMNSEEVARLYDRWWARRFVPKYRKANPGPKTRELDYELAERKKAFRRIVQFDGSIRTFDKAEFRDEFVHGNGESMSSAKVYRRGSGAEPRAISYTRRFFFFQDRLWKVYDEYRLEPRGLLGADFKEAIERVAGSLGSGAKRTRGPASPGESVAFETAGQRVRVVKLSSDRVALVRADKALAKQVLDRRAQQVSVKDEPLDEDTRAALK